MEVGEEEWEWEWKCTSPRIFGEEQNEQNCLYESGRELIMPGTNQQQFISEQGEQLIEGKPLFFSVKAKVIERGQVIGEGSWSGVINPVKGEGRRLQITQEHWICPDSSVGFEVIEIMIVVFIVCVDYGLFNLFIFFSYSFFEFYLGFRTLS